MTTRLLIAPPKVPPHKQFPTFPPRDDMQNILHLHEPAHVPVLRRWLGNETSVIVISELPLGWVAKQQRDYLIPDLLVAFHVNRDDIIREGGYAINEWGKPPEFVMEVASPNNARNDYISKRGGIRQLRRSRILALRQHRRRPLSRSTGRRLAG